MEWGTIFPPTNIRIKVDANDGTHIASVVHELLHIVFYTMFLGYVDETLEEVGILAYDAYMYDYVSRSPTRFSLWNKIIEEKLLVGTTPTSFDEQVAR